MATTSPRYDASKIAGESGRLRNQQLLFNDAVGFLQAPLKLDQEGLQVLDSATADGSWLVELSKQLPTTASLVGTDLTAYPQSVATTLPSNVKLSIQDIKKPWPQDWHSSFDLVHQKLVLSQVPDADQRRQCIQALVDLVKPGGWIQLDEGGLPTGEIGSSDPPSLKLFKGVATMGMSSGMDMQPHLHIKPVLESMPELQEVHYKEGSSRIGKGASSSELSQLGLENVLALHAMASAFFARAPPGKVPLSAEEFAGLREEVMKEAETNGFGMFWNCAWAQKK